MAPSRCRWRCALGSRARSREWWSRPIIAAESDTPVALNSSPLQRHRVRALLDPVGERQQLGCFGRHRAALAGNDDLAVGRVVRQHSSAVAARRYKLISISTSRAGKRDEVPLSGGDRGANGDTLSARPVQAEDVDANEHTIGNRPEQRFCGAPGWNRTSDTRFRKPTESVTGCSRPCAIALHGPRFCRAFVLADVQPYRVVTRRQVGISSATVCHGLRRSSSFGRPRAHFAEATGPRR